MHAALFPFHRYALCVMLACASVFTAVLQPASAMEVYRGRKRVLVVFAPSTDHPGFTRQRNIINGNRTQLLDRDVVVVYVVGGSVSYELGGAQSLGASALRLRFKVGDGQFRVMLHGKDGTHKFDQLSPLASGDLIAEIDRNPKRRENLRKSDDL
jgi:Domain of unknown function (DUF4174)